MGYKKSHIGILVGVLILIFTVVMYNLVVNSSKQKQEIKTQVQEEVKQQTQKTFKVYYLTLGKENKLVSREVTIDYPNALPDAEILKTELLKLEQQGIKSAINSKTNFKTIAVNEIDKVATIDLNEEYIKYMRNSGTATEELTIQALVDTIGSFYKVEKVGLTVEGKPYESGHIKLEEGEYFKVTKN